MIGEDRAQLALFVVQRSSFSRSFVRSRQLYFVVDRALHFLFVFWKQRPGAPPKLGLPARRKVLRKFCEKFRGMTLSKTLIGQRSALGIWR